MYRLLGVSSLTVLLAGCTVYHPQLSNGHYWQRVSNTSALYMRGPQAQHQLNKDIADCVVEMRELERLGSLRDAVPANLDAPRSDGADSRSKTALFDSPNKDEINYARYFDYADFEGCMDSKGWERVEYVPYDTAEQARGVYVETIIDQHDRKGRPRSYDGIGGTASTSTEDAYDDLNQ